MFVSAHDDPTIKIFSWLFVGEVKVYGISNFLGTDQVLLLLMSLEVRPTTENSVVALMQFTSEIDLGPTLATYGR